MSSVNCQNTPAAQAALLATIPQLVASAATKGTFSASLVPGIVAILNATIAPVLALRGGNAFPQLFDAYLPNAVSGAVRQQAAVSASAVAAPGSSPADPTGLGPAAGWPVIPASGPGGAGWAGPGAGAAPWPVARAGLGTLGLTADPSLAQVGALAPGGFFSTMAPPSGPAGGRAATQPGESQAAAAALSSSSVPVVSASGAQAVNGAISQYFNRGRTPTGDDSFVLAEWIGDDVNPLLIRPEIANAILLHQNFILPCCRYYKGLIYGDPDYPVRLEQILWGIVSPATVTNVLFGGPTNRHLVGEAVNFMVDGIDPSRVCDDVQAGNIQVQAGTYGAVNGIHATLPFTTNGVEIKNMRLYAASGVPGYVSYAFQSGGQAA